MRMLKPLWAVGWPVHPERLVFIGKAQEHIGAFGDMDNSKFHLVFPGDQMSLRGALSKSKTFLRNLDFPQDLIGPVELVLAEAVNNIIEHAYAGGIHGIVDLTISCVDGDLMFSILDDGLPMPDDRLPEGDAHNLDCDTEDLPEGGFGWFMIRELTSDLVYTRTGNRNRLEFRMSLNG
ncbi:MAG TPA: ATP-binding protein [Aliiroseovarius sp.]|nr:ATP-binding protein [Aliiroseovarius sp.]